MKFFITTSDDKINDLNDEVKNQGEKFSRRITKAFKKESWKWVLVELAWTAGITVLIGLYAGYYLGYGKLPDPKLVIYFGTYSVVAVIMALIVKMIRNAASEKESRNHQRMFLRCNNHIFHLMHTSRNMSMQGMEEMQRRIFAASIILKDPEATSDDLQVAVLDLTGDTKLSRTVQRIETYRQHSLQARIDDEFKKAEDILTEHVESLKESAPVTAQILYDRFQGEAPNMQTGQERPVGFLERTLQAIESNDLNIMAFDDVYEIFRLTFELLNDREILSLHPEFKGHEDYVEAQEKLDKSRALLKNSIAKRNNRLMAVAELLISISKTDAVMPTTFDSDELVQLINGEYEDIKNIINQQIKDKDYAGLRETHRILKQSFKFLDKVELHQRRSERFSRAFNSIRKTYNKAWKKHGTKITKMLEEESLSTNKAGLHIREEIIQLDDTQKITIANKINNLHNHTRLEQRKKYMRFTGIEFSQNAIKRLATEYALILDEAIQFSQPEEMQAIEYSQAPAFDHIDSNTPTRSKVGMALLSIEELQQTRQKVAHRLARNLREYYKVPLNSSIIKYLCENFGADKEYLSQLNKENLATTERMEEKYNVNLKTPDWQKKMSPQVKKIRNALSK